MKYSISARQPIQILEQTEEINVSYADREILLDYINGPLAEKEILLVISKEQSTNVDFNFLQMLNEKLHITIATDNLDLGEQCKALGLSFCWSFPVTTYYDLQTLIEIGVNQILLGIPLVFDLSHIKTLVGSNIKLRLVANVAYPSYLHRANGIVGSYVRPEDVSLYEQYIDYLQFNNVSLGQERQLFLIYHNDKQWPGNLSFLITNLDIDIDNRAIPEAFAKARINCRQKCQINNSCHLCTNIFRYVNGIDKAKFNWDLELHTWKDEEI